MLTIFSTGDRESDLYHWSKFLQKHPELKDIPRIDCSIPAGVNKLVRKVETISLLTEEMPIIANFIELNEETVALLSSYSQNVYILTPAGKLPKLDSTVNIVTEKIGDTQLKSLITDTLRTLNVSVSREDLIRMYIPLSTEDFMGKEKLSPLRCLTFVRQLMTIEASTPEDSAKLLTALIGIAEGKASQWEILSNLFSTHKKRQKEYFSNLAQSMSPFEIIARAKTSILLIMVILIGKEEALDSTSISVKIGKSLGYVSSLLRSVQEKSITYDKAHKMLVRLFNLESALKSGKFDDEHFGFEVLLATM